MARSDVFQPDTAQDPSAILGPLTDSVTISSGEPPSRKRPASPTNINPTLRKIASTASEKGRRSNSPRQGKQAATTVVPMTAAAAIAEDAEERAAKDRMSASGSAPTSPNPATQVISLLRGQSSNSDATPSAPQPPISDAMKAIAQSLDTTAAEKATDTQVQTSPTSMSSFGTLGSSTALTAPPIISAVESPGSMEDAVQSAVAEMRESTGDASPSDGNKAFSYPGPILAQQLADQNRRGMSLPHSASRQAGSRSPSAKKHKCPYCATEFTRHHNLKSHLLTHSQEKPYVCQTCQSRFRRLHDLKRHTKLHTGERPHICPKCGRRFARGDALARHNKGPGGCAGRRASVGSYGDENDFTEGNEDSMDGLVYTEPGTIDDAAEGEPRPGMPSIRRHDAPDEAPQQSAGPSYQSRQPSTYPPIQGRPPGGIAGGLFPPPGPGGASPASASPNSQTNTLSYPSAAGTSLSHGQGQPGSHVLPHGGITESPKPLSPGSGGPQHAHGDGSIYRNRSPSANTPFPHHQYSRSSSRRTPPIAVGGSLPPPAGLGPQLPPPSQLNPPDSRYTLPSQGPAHPPTGPTGPPTHMSGGGLSSQSNSLSSHGHSHHGSGEGANSLYPQVGREDRLWASVKSLEERVNGLQEEVSSLRAQLAVSNQSKQ